MQVHPFKMVLSYLRDRLLHYFPPSSSCFVHSRFSICLHLQPPASREKEIIFET